MSDAFKEFVERREAQIRGGKSSGGSMFWILLGIAVAVVLLFLVFKGDSTTGPLNPNTATAEAIATLDGIGPEIAKGVIAGRPYTKPEDLLKVPGIGPKTLNKIKPRLKWE